MLNAFMYKDEPDPTEILKMAILVGVHEEDATEVIDGLLKAYVELARRNDREPIMLSEREFYEVWEKAYCKGARITFEEGMETELPYRYPTFPVPKLYTETVANVLGERARARHRYYTELQQEN